MAQNRLKDFGGWVVTNDNSIVRPDNTPYKFIGFEINTAVEMDTPESFEALQYGIQCLTSQHRTIVNPSCGLHVHVGNGAGAFPLESTRRIGALLWSAEALLGTLHPPWRRINSWCTPIRTATRLAAGEDEPDLAHDSYPAFICRYVGGDVRYGERSTLWRAYHGSKKAENLYHESRAAAGNLEPWRVDEGLRTYYFKEGKKVDPEEVEGKLPVSYPEPNHSFNFAIPTNESLPGASGTSSRSDSPSASTKSSGSPEPPDPDNFLSQHELSNRVAELPKDRFFIPRAPRRFTTRRPRCNAPKTPTIDEVDQSSKKHYQLDSHPDAMTCAAKRPAGLLFGAARLLAAETSCEISRLLQVEHNGGGKPNYNFEWYNCYCLSNEDRHTIEFREAESSLDPVWVATWAKICVGLVKFAVNAPAHAFMRVITNCDLAEKGREYDVVDLLNQIGLFAEAAAAAERIWAKREAWNLTFSEGDGGDSDDGPDPGKPGDRDDSNPGNGPSSGNGPSPGNGSGPSDDNSRPDDKPNPEGNPNPGKDADPGNGGKPGDPKPEECKQENDSNRDSGKTGNATEQDTQPSNEPKLGSDDDDDDDRSEWFTPDESHEDPASEDNGDSGSVLDKESNDSNASLDSIDKIDGLHSIDGDTSNSSSRNSNSSDDNDDDDGGDAARSRKSRVIRQELPKVRTDLGLAGTVFARTWEQVQSPEKDNNSKSPIADIESPTPICGMQ